MIRMDFGNIKLVYDNDVTETERRLFEDIIGSLPLAIEADPNDGNNLAYVFHEAFLGGKPMENNFAVWPGREYRSFGSFRYRVLENIDPSKYKVAFVTGCVEIRPAEGSEWIIDLHTD